MRKLYPLLGALLLLTLSFNAWADSQRPAIRIGVRAHHGPKVALERWQATADYLTQQIPTHHFTLAPYQTFSELATAVQNNELEFIVTNPANYIEMESTYGVTRLATMINQQAPQGLKQFSSVMITSADRDDIHSLQDFPGKTILAVDEQAFGGWWMGLKELRDNGIDPYTSCEIIFTSGQMHKQVIEGILSGQADIGFIRTGVLERMEKNDRLDRSRLKIINQYTDAFPLPHSTALYPEWPFSKLPHTQDTLAKQVLSALLALPVDSEAARSVPCLGWTIPLDYTPVHRLMQQLQVGPYEKAPEPFWSTLYERYQKHFWLITLLILVLLASLTYITWLNRRLRSARAKLELRVKERTVTLEQSNQQLQQQIAERQQVEQMLHAVAEQISTNTGTAFFKALCEKMAQTLEVNYVLIGRVKPQHQHTIDTVAVFDTQQLIDNFTYSVQGTPCAEVLNEGRNLYSQNLQQHFPENRRIRERGWDSYAAIPLRTVDKKIIGILVIMDTKPINNPQTTLTILQAFAYRISAELMRIKTETDLKLLATTFETHEAIAILDPQMRYVRVNQSFCDITGYTSDEIIGKANSILWDDHHCDSDYEDVYQQLFTQGHWQGELSRKRKDGSIFLQWGGLTAVYDGATISHYVESFLDFTQQKKQQERIEQSGAEEQSLGQLLRISLRPSSLSDYLNEVLDCLLVAVPWLNLLKKGAVFLLNKDDQSLHLTASRGFSEKHLKTCRQVAIGSCLCGKAALENKILFCDHTTNCLERYYDESSPHGHYMIPFSQEQKVIGVLALHLNANHPYSKEEEEFLYRVADIISMGVNRRSYEEHIEFLAYHDLLTDLPNRRLLLDRLEQEQAISQRIGTIGAVLSVDLDRFKNTNDALGHTVGDLVLQETARRLEFATLTGDTVTRLSSDEFVIFLPALSTDIDEASIKAQDMAEAILDKISQPYQLAGHDFSLTASIGIALFTAEVDNPTELLQFADAAMHHAKSEGGNNFQFFHPTMQSKAELRLVLERELNKAIDNEELQLYCQPQVDHIGRIRGAEFLIRWQHPEQGLISPGQFIPVAEETGQIKAIDAWVLKTACTQYCRWQQQQQLTELESISINISPQLFHQGNFVAMVKQILDQTQMPADKLILELTEGILIKDIEGAIKKMDLLHRQGLRFSIDDFGTGYSSMSYLKRLSIDELKIDQSFIRDLTASRQDAAIVETIITMAKQLNLSLVSEGVETQSQRDLLYSKGCQIFQGYYFSKPLPIDELPAYQPSIKS